MRCETAFRCAMHLLLARHICAQPYVQLSIAADANLWNGKTSARPSPYTFAGRLPGPKCTLGYYDYHSQVLFIHAGQPFSSARSRSPLPSAVPALIAPPGRALRQQSETQARQGGPLHVSFLPALESGLSQSIDENGTLPFRASLDARRDLVDFAQHMSELTTASVAQDDEAENTTVTSAPPASPRRTQYHRHSTPLHLHPVP